MRLCPRACFAATYKTKSRSSRKGTLDLKFLKGRQILTLRRYYEISEEDDAILEFQDLLEVKLVGNDTKTFLVIVTRSFN